MFQHGIGMVTFWSTQFAGKHGHVSQKGCCPTKNSISPARYPAKPRRQKIPTSVENVGNEGESNSVSSIRRIATTAASTGTHTNNQLEKDI
eukprot:6482738-Amphidinium_carterae.1